MSVLLNRSYAGYPAGTVVTLNASTEAAIIAQGIGQASASTPTTGNVSTSEHNGRVSFAAGATSLTVTNPNVTPSSKVGGRINQATADTNMTGIRIVPGNGQFTIYPNNVPAAATTVDWELISTGLTPNQ